jgi:hypothetical protein
MHPAKLSTVDLLKQCEMRLERRSGPGGQHRNKVETAVVLKHKATEIEAEANERRSQAENKRVAAFRLSLALAVQHRSRLDATDCDPSTHGAVSEYSPSECWNSRLIGRRLKISIEHEDFPALLAEALDAIAATEFDLASAAERLRISSSQLVKLLGKHPPALRNVNEQRKQRGLHAYKIA